MMWFFFSELTQQCFSEHLLFLTLGVGFLVDVCNNFLYTLFPHLPLIGLNAFRNVAYSHLCHFLYLKG